VGLVETAAAGRLVEGLQAFHADDTSLLEQGVGMFEALGRSFEPDGRVRWLDEPANASPTVVHCDQENGHASSISIIVASAVLSIIGGLPVSAQDVPAPYKKC